MIGALIILLVTVSVGFLLYVYDLKWRRQHPQETVTDKDSDIDIADSSPTENSAEEDNGSHGSICCGRHLICEKSLSPLPGEEIVYYDDEELDRFAGKDADAYTPEEVEEIRDVMMTLLPADVPGWARSLQLRKIELPAVLRDEFFLLLEEA